MVLCVSSDFGETLGLTWIPQGIQACTNDFFSAVLLCGDTAPCPQLCAQQNPPGAALLQAWHRSC